MQSISNKNWNDLEQIIEMNCSTTVSSSENEGVSLWPLMSFQNVITLKLYH